MTRSRPGATELPSAAEGLSPERPACRSCGSTELKTFLSLGPMPVANALLRPEEVDDSEPRVPLDVAFCPECTLVQLLESVPPDELFPEDYPYFSSYADDLLEHARNHALSLVETRGLGPRSLVVEVGSNDGYLLKNFAEAGVPVLGIDPAPIQAAVARAAGVPTVCEFFGAGLARRLREEGRRADVIIANNVMAHTPHLNSFVEGVGILLADDGIATIENPYVKDLIERRAFDTIYHEHFSYFSCTAVDALMRRHGLFLNRVEHFPLHGGTLRWSVAPREEVGASARAYLRQEAEEGLLEFAYYEAFRPQVEGIREKLVGLLEGIGREGLTVAAYGAAAKGSTLLNYVGVGPDLVQYVVDRNVHKQDLLMPGVRIPIRDPSKVLETMPDYLLLLAWNFKDEIIRQQSEYRRRGGRFIVPIPTPEVV